MTACPKNLRLLALLEDIRSAIESDAANNAATRPNLVTKITNLRDAVEAPQDSLLRIYSQVSEYLNFRRFINPEVLMASISAATKCGTESSC